MSKITFLENERIMIEGATIMYPNFSGEARKFNNAGNRNFVVIIDDPDVAMRLQEDGWNVTCSRPRFEDEEPYYKLAVAVSFRSMPPYIHPAKLYLISNGRQTKLSENTANLMDEVDVANIDLIIRPRHLSEPTPSGNTIKAYLVELRATITPSPLDEKYAEYESPEEAPWSDED